MVRRTPCLLPAWRDVFPNLSSEKKNSLASFLFFRYIKEYVTCHTCRSPDTILQKDTRLFFLQCETCGSRCSVASIKSGFQVKYRKKMCLFGLLHRFDYRLLHRKEQQSEQKRLKWSRQPIQLPAISIYIMIICNKCTFMY